MSARWSILFQRESPEGVDKKLKRFLGVPLELLKQQFRDDLAAMMIGLIFVIFVVEEGALQSHASGRKTGPMAWLLGAEGRGLVALLETLVSICVVWWAIKQGKFLFAALTTAGAAFIGLTLWRHLPHLLQWGTIGAITVLIVGAIYLVDRVFHLVDKLGPFLEGIAEGLFPRKKP